MSNLTTASKIGNFIEKRLSVQLEKWAAMLCSGELQTYEQELSSTLRDVYNYISEQLLCVASKEASSELRDQGKARGGRKIVLRRLQVRIATGAQLEVQSPYVKVGNDWNGSRHLLADHWNLIGGASPALFDKVGYCAALGPSYDLAQQTLRKFGVSLSLSSVRDLTNHLAKHCYQYGEEKLALKAEETLAGKRVVISTDGGRTRTRLYDGQVNESGQATYQTPWREPKLFVIEVLNDEGKPQRGELPIYGCRFGESDMLNLLERYLKRLKINKAKHVQIIADGAPWIWNNIKPLLERLDVAPSRITETLDYYHGSQYVHDLVNKMPKRISSKKRKEYLAQFKTWLWEGSANKIVQQCRSIYKRPSQIIRRYINYLEKHQNKTQYALYQGDNLMCGSGIIESGVRRIINLRFKNASTFWKKEIVEKLYFLRASLLSKRWDILMKNLAPNS